MYAYRSSAAVSKVESGGVRYVGISEWVRYINIGVVIQCNCVLVHVPVSSIDDRMGYADAVIEGQQGIGLDVMPNKQPW